MPRKTMQIAITVALPVTNRRAKLTSSGEVASKQMVLNSIAENLQM